MVDQRKGPPGGLRLASALLASCCAAPAHTFELPPTNAASYPLFVHSPYTSWWLRGGDPTISDVWHVKQDKRAGMSAMVRVHNQSYRLLGDTCTPGVRPFPRFVSATVHPTRTVLSYAGLGLRINCPPGHQGG